MSDDISIGAIFPQAEIAAKPAAIAAWARTVEQLGYDHLVAYDHVIGAHPHRPEDPRAARWPQNAYDHESLFHEPMVLFGYLAAITERIELTTGVIVLPQRQTVLAAKQLAEVDVLSGGRLRVGVGLGWNHVEYEALNERFETRGRRLEEQAAVLRALWTEPVVDFDGRWHRIPRAGIKPLPVQRPIPLWLGGHADAALARVARVADGWLSSSDAFSPAVEPMLAALRGHLAAAGRDPGAFPFEGRVDLPGRTPDDWRRGIERWRALGASHVAVNTLRGGLEPAAQLELVERFMATVER